MKDIIKSSTLIGSTEFALIFVAIIRAKYLAVSIGPAGYGEYGLLNSFFTVLTAVCGGWIARGTIKYTAEYSQKNDFLSVAKVHNYSISLALILGSIATLFVFIFQDFVRIHFLSPEIILWHYSLFAASFLANSLIPFFGWLLQGHLMVKSTIKLRIITTFFSLISIFVFVYFFKLTGYFLSILVSAVFGLYLFWNETRNILPTKFLLPNIKDEIFKKLMKFGGVNLVLLTVNNVCDYIQRVFILTNLNISSVGLFQVANSITNYMGILNRGSSFVNDPKMSQDISILERNKVFNDFLRFNILVGIPISVFLILFSTELIGILYTKEFTTLSPIIYVFIFAQFLSFLCGGFQSIMLGKAFLKMHSFVSILYSVILITVPLLFIKQFGLITIGISMVVANILTIIIDFIYLRRQINISINMQVIILLIISIVLFFITTEIQSFNFLYKLFFIVIMAIILILSLNKVERIQLINLLRNVIFKK